MEAYNSLYTGEHNDLYDIRITTNTNNITTKVSKAGDTMTGSLNINQTSDSWLKAFYVKDPIYNSSNLPPSETLRYLCSVTGSDNEAWGYIRCSIDLNNTHRLGIFGRNVINNSGELNGITLGMTTSGTATVSLTHPAVWREGLEISKYSMVPGSTSATIAATTSSTTNNWVIVWTNYEAPSNGYINCYLLATGASPAAVISDITSGMQSRENGNGSRDYSILMPVIKGHKYQLLFVYTTYYWGKFFPAATGL